MKKIFLAVIIGTFVGCTDYLDKYQDEAIIAAENTDDEISSSSENDALSSANVESSSSAKSSSNANDKSSSSVAASSSSEEPASSSALSSSITSGTEVTECDGDSIFVDEKPYIGRGLVTNGLMPATNVYFSDNNREYFYVFDSLVNKTPFDISSWDGLCIEYITSAEFHVSLRYANTGNIGSSTYSVIKIPPTSSRTARFWEWKEFSRTGVLRAQMTSLLQFSLPYRGSIPEEAIIYKITTKTKSGKTASIAKLDTAKSITVDKLKWDLNSPNEEKATTFHYENASAQCNPLGKRLPTTDEWKNLFKEFGDIESVPTYTYEFLFGNTRLTNFSYVDFSSKEEKGKRAFWTNNMDLVEFSGDLGSLELNYLSGEQNSYKNAVAEFRCVEDIK